MKNKYIVLVLPFIALVIASLACVSQVEANRAAETRAAEKMQETLESMLKTQTAEPTKDPEITITPSPTCEYVIGGVCVSYDIEIPIIGDDDTDFEETQSAYEEQEVIFWGKVLGNKSIEIYDQAGEGGKEVGRLFPVEFWPVNESVSGWIRPEGVDGHYLGMHLTCWFEKIDFDDEIKETTGIEHTWDHQNGETLEHAHCQSDNGNLIAWINDGVKVVKVLEVDETREVYKVVLEMLWINSQGIQKTE